MTAGILCGGAAAVFSLQFFARAALHSAAYVGNDPLNRVDPKGLCSSVADTGKQADCLEKRGAAVENAKEHLAGQSVRSGANEAAYIATYNEDTGDVSVRTGDAAGRRTNEDVAFTDDSGKPLVARPDGRIVDRGDDGSVSDTNEIVLATGHAHPRESGGGRINDVDNANESIRRNPDDKALSRVAPAVIKTPSGRIRVFVDEREVKDEY